jgi:hypothetical protein
LGENNMQTMKKTFLIIFFLFLSSSYSVYASSTNLIPIKSDFVPDANVNYSLDNSYINITLVSTRVSPKFSLYDKIKHKGTKTVISYEFLTDTGISDSKISAPLAIPKKNKPVDLAWEKAVVVNLPASYSSASLITKVSTTAKDGLEELINAAAELSLKTPEVTISKGALSLVSAGKALADYVFNNKLIKSIINADLLIPESSGMHVSFSADSSTDYDKYTKNIDKLKWSDGALRYDGNEITDVSYFIVKVEYFSRLYPVRDLRVLTRNQANTWAEFYSKVNKEIKGASLTTIDKVRKDINELFTVAFNFIDKDLKLVYNEREDIHNALENLLNNKLLEREVMLGYKSSTIKRNEEKRVFLASEEGESLPSQEETLFRSFGELKKLMNK